MFLMFHSFLYLSNKHYIYRKQNNAAYTTHLHDLCTIIYLHGTTMTKGIKRTVVDYMTRKRKDNRGSGAAEKHIHAATISQLEKQIMVLRNRKRLYKDVGQLILRG